MAKQMKKMGKKNPAVGGHNGMNDSEYTMSPQMMECKKRMMKDMKMSAMMGDDMMK